jgi:outer membrane lipoprotein-sorting protein
MAVQISALLLTSGLPTQSPTLRLFTRFAFCALLSTPAIAASADATSVLAPQRQRIQTADYRVTARLVNTDAAGTRVSYSMTIKAHWFPEGLRVLLDVTSPAASRQRVLLELTPSGGEEIFLARPGDTALKAVSPARWSEGFLGSNLSLEDFLEPEYFWPNQILQGPARRGARDCNLVQSTPTPSDSTRYAEVKTWLDKTIGFPVYAEKNLKTSGAVKEVTSIDLRHEGGVWSAGQVQIDVRNKPGSSLLIIDRGSAKANLTMKDFSPDALVHFEGGL